jgi:hypothetical protein
MGVAGSTHGKDENIIQDFGVKLWRDEATRMTHPQMDLREIGREGVDWIHLTQDRDQWRTLVNTAMGPIKGGEFPD